MFFNDYKKMHGGDLIEDNLEEASSRLDLLKEVRKDLLYKSKNILWNKNIPCNNVYNLKQLTKEIDKYDFEQKIKAPRFDENVIDLRDQVKSGEILLMVKAGSQIIFNIVTHGGEKYTVEWEENSEKKKSVIASGREFNKVAPTTGISSEDGSFKYTIYRIYTSGVIKGYTIRDIPTGKGPCWFVSKGINFVELHLAVTNRTATSHAYQDLQYVDILDGGTECIRAGYCENLLEIEADYINFTEKFSANYIFANCKKLRKLPSNSFFQSYNFTCAFTNCYALTKLPEIDLSMSTNNDSIFSGCKSLIAFKNDSIKVNRNAYNAYFAKDCTSLTKIPDITYSDDILYTGTNWTQAFYGCTNATKMPASLNLSYCKAGIGSMFEKCSNIIDGPSEILLYNNLTDKTTYNAANMFRDCTALRSITGTITSVNVNSCSSMFRDCRSLKKAPRCVFPNTLSCDYMYNGCSTLITPPDTIDYPKAMTAIHMFSECKLLQLAPKNINLAKCLSISYMFNNCNAMVAGPVTINISSSTDNTYAFTNCSSMVNFGQADTLVKLYSTCDNTYMFNNCSSLKTISDFSGGRVFSYMFNNAGLERHPSISTSSYANCQYMFHKCALKTVDFNRIDAPYCMNFNYAFSYCPIEGDIVIDLTKFTKAMFFNYMFREVKMTSVDIIFPESAAEITYIFYGCVDLKTIKMNILGNPIAIDDPFYGCSFLESIELNGDFKGVHKFADFVQTYFKTLKINAPNWSFHHSGADTANKFNVFTNLETCNIVIDINNLVEIKNNKKLHDMDLILKHESGIKKSVVINISGNAFNADVLNKIIGNLPNVNEINKEYEGLTAEINIANNPGTNDCDHSIAKSKGWIVYTS